MKHIKLFLVALLLMGGCIPSLKAQILKNNAEPEILILNGRGELETASVTSVISLYNSTIEKGFRQVGLPRFIITGREQKMIFGIGGNVAVRGSYDFGGIANALDFVTSAIPVPFSKRTQQQFQLDPSTSTIYFKAIAKAGRLGPIVGYIKTDFRGSQNTNLFLREAYVTVGGFLVGRNFTTFCDLASIPSTVDFEGPNTAPLLYNTMIRYTRKFGQHWSAALALEMPSISTTKTANISNISQRMPDIPMYGQYAWNEGASHIRLSAVFRNMVYFVDSEDKARSTFGWATQLSGMVQATKKLTTYFQLVYGEGAAAYLQDIYQTGLDLVPDPRNGNRLQALPMTGWSAGLQYAFNSAWIATAAYSGLHVSSRFGYEAASTYKLAQYVSTNLFYNLSPSCQLGLSYMYGIRKNMNDQHGQANRIQGIIQYNF